MKKTILIISDEPIGNEGNSHQHYTDYLSSKYKVVFANPPVRWSILNVFKKHKLKRFDQIDLYFYKNYFPLRPSFLFKFFSILNDYLNVKFLKQNHILPDILIYFDPFRGVYFKQFLKNDPQIIYIVLDPCYHLPLDAKMSKTANRIYSVNSRFYDHYKNLNSSVEIIPHGISKDELIIDDMIVDKYIRLYGNYILFVGSLNDDVDFTLMIKIAKKYTDNNLVIIGKLITSNEEKINEFNSLTDLTNVKYLGFIDYKKLKEYIKASEICIVPYDTSRSDFGRNPIKITNYLAQYKPIVNTVRLVDLERLENKVLFTFDNHIDFINCIDDLLCNRKMIDKNFITKYIEENKYDNIINRIII